MLHRRDIDFCNVPDPATLSARETGVVGATRRSNRFAKRGIGSLKSNGSIEITLSRDGASTTIVAFSASPVTSHGTGLMLKVSQSGTGLRIGDIS